ncbi:MAG: transporter [bacterium]
MKIKTAAAVFALIASQCFAEESKAPAKIADNSFLIEEAYNQEPGVIQHINAFQYNREDHSWLYTFTEEIPAPSQKHQLSFMIPVEKIPGETGSTTGLGDILLNYRYQLFADDRIAIAPRISVILPTGDSDRGLGTGKVGWQINLPVSLDVNDLWSVHWNMGATYYNNATDAAGNTDHTLGLFYGASAIACLSPTFNLMLEVVGGSDEEVAGDHQTERSDWFFVNPGMRGAINFKSGLQIVPGLSIPIGVGPSSGEAAAFFYLSFEHPAF